MTTAIAPAAPAVRPTVSVVMATYNGQRYIAEQLQSILAQTVLPDEIVVADDRSTDGTAGMVAEFARRHPELNVRLTVNDRRLGSSRNFSAAASRCTGDIVVFADQDDVWLDDRIAASLDALAADPAAAAVFGDASFIDDRGKPRSGTIFDSVYLTDAEKHRFADGGGFEVLIRRNVCTGATMAVHRAALAPCLPFSEHLVHDYFLALSLALRGRLVLLDRPLIKYRLHGGQQIGFVAGGAQAVRKAMALIRGANEARLAQLALGLRDLRPMAAAAAGGTGPTAPSTLLEQKIAFLEERRRLRSSRALAPVRILALAANGGYRRFALGWRGVVLDLGWCALRPRDRGTA